MFENYSYIFFCQSFIYYYSTGISLKLDFPFIWRIIHYHNYPDSGVIETYFSRLSMSVNIYAGNLPYTITEENLRTLFEKHGQVSSVKIITDRSTGNSKGFGFIEMNLPQEAEKAIQILNGFEVSGRNIRVNFAKPRKD